MQLAPQAPLRGRLINVLAFTNDTFLFRLEVSKLLLHAPPGVLFSATAHYRPNQYENENGCNNVGADDYHAILIHKKIA